MSSNIVHYSGTSPGQGQGLASVRPPAHQENPVLMLHRFLRGRYPMAITLAVLLAIPGGIAGYLAVTPAYTSTGIIRIAPTLPRLLYQVEDNQVPPHFDSFVSTQASMLSNRRVLDLAASDKDLRAAGWPAGPEGITRLSKALKVSNRRGSELITAQVEHTDPRLAQLAVNAVLAAYESVQDELTGMTATEREQALRTRQRELQRQIESTNAQIRNLAGPFHTDKLEPRLNGKLATIDDLEGRIASLRFQLATARTTAGAADGTAAEGEAEPASEQAPVPEVELEHFAARDRVLAGLLDQRLAVKTEIEARASRLGPEHRRMAELRRRLDAFDAEIADRVAVIRQHNLYPQAQDGTFAAGDQRGMSIAQMEGLLSDLLELLSREKREAGEISSTHFAISGLKDRLVGEEASLRTTSTRLEQIEVENTYVSAGRVSILQRGDLPGAPSKDRRIPLAAFGTMSGAGLGLGFVVLLTLLQGGYRYIDELERAEGPASLLGTVPDLSNGGPEHAALAALSVHHLRNMLQMNTPPTNGGTIYTVSSAMAGDGKTSLALSLAMSFAAMGNRTLLIDADLIGCGLSRQLTLSTRPGLSQALKSSTLNGEVHATRVDNLWAIPAGFAEGAGGNTRTGPASGGIQPEQIAQSDLRRVLSHAREQFDTVIIDTGPILGSLEANLIAPMSDRVVLVVSRGQGSKFVRSALDRISRLGAVCGGLVFNRAEVNDFDRSISAVSLSGRSLREQASHRSSPPAPGTLALLDAVSTQSRDRDPDTRT